PCGQGIETYARDRARAVCTCRVADARPIGVSSLAATTIPNTYIDIAPCTWTFPIRPTLLIYSGAWHSSFVPPKTYWGQAPVDDPCIFLIGISCIVEPSPKLVTPSVGQNVLPTKK